MQKMRPTHYLQSGELESGTIPAARCFWGAIVGIDSQGAVVVSSEQVVFAHHLKVVDGHGHYMQLCWLVMDTGHSCDIHFFQEVRSLKAAF